MMTLQEFIAGHYEQSLEWAARWLRLFENIERDIDVFEHVCKASRDVYAAAAVNESECTSPRYAYLRGRSDTYHDMPKSFLEAFASIRDDFRAKHNEIQGELN